MPSTATTRRQLCAGLETEAYIAGKLIRVPKHSPVIEAYGSIEEAEALLARARLGLEARGEKDLAKRLEKLQQATRLVPILLAGAATLKEITGLVEEAEKGLEDPWGWSLTGCAPEDPDIMLAATRLRAAERSITRASLEEGTVPSSLAALVSEALTRIAYALYKIHWRLCSREAKAKTSRELIKRQ